MSHETKVVPNVLVWEMNRLLGGLEADIKSSKTILIDYYNKDTDSWYDERAEELYKRLMKITGEL